METEKRGLFLYLREAVHIEITHFCPVFVHFCPPKSQLVSAGFCLCELSLSGAQKV